MTHLLEFKEKLRTFYSKFDRVLIGLLKFVATFAVLMVIYGRTTTLPDIPYAPVVFLALSLICAVFPEGMINVVVCFLAAYRMYQVGIEALMIYGMVMLIIICLYMVFRPEKASLMSFMMAVTCFKIPAILVVPIGMIFGPFAAIPLCFGMMLGNYYEFVCGNLSMLMGTKETMTLMQKVVFLTNGLLKNNLMWLCIVATIITVGMVYVIRKLSVNYSWLIAAITGAVIYVVVVLFGGYMIGIDVDVLRTILPAIVGLLCVVFIYVFVVSLDYSRVEHVQFEDEDYYYYVKAVPKMAVAKAQPKVKTISKRVEQDEAPKPEAKTEPEKVTESEDKVIPVVLAKEQPEVVEDYEEQPQILVEKVKEERFLTLETEETPSTKAEELQKTDEEDHYDDDEDDFEDDPED